MPDRLTQVKDLQNYAGRAITRWCRGARWQCGFKALCLFCIETSAFYSLAHFSVLRLTPQDLCSWVWACCAAVQNPCAVQNGGCMHGCRADGGKAHCDCKVGFILAEDRKTCQGKFTVNTIALEWEVVRRTYRQFHKCSKNWLKIISSQLYLYKVHGQ